MPVAKRYSATAARWAFRAMHYLLPGAASPIIAPDRSFRACKLAGVSDYILLNASQLPRHDAGPDLTVSNVGLEARIPGWKYRKAQK
jgi:hypothetical protein